MRAVNAMLDSRGAAGLKVVFLVVLTLAVLLALGAALLTKSDRTPQRIAAKGDQAPDFQLKGIDGTTANLADYRGKVVLLHFWATWCPPCVEEMPLLEEFYRSQFGTPLEILAISVDERPEDAIAFIRKSGVHFPVLLDPDKKVAAKYGTFKFPETYIIDKNGVIREKIIGARDWTVPENVRTALSLMQ